MAVASAAQKLSEVLKDEPFATLDETGPPFSESSAKALEEEVLAVGRYGLISVSLSDVGDLAIGDRLDVFRSASGKDRWLARLVVIGMEAGQAVGKIVPEFQKGAT